jgi:hypothetical protein
MLYLVNMCKCDAVKLTLFQRGEQNYMIVLSMRKSNGNVIVEAELIAGWKTIEVLSAISLPVS